MEEQPIAWVLKRNAHHKARNPRARGPRVHFAEDGWHVHKVVGSWTMIQLVYSNSPVPHTVAATPQRMKAIYDKSELPAVYERVR